MFELIGKAAVLECLPHDRLLELGVAFGLWDLGHDRPARGRLPDPLAGAIEALSRQELIEGLCLRRGVTPRALWYALTTPERIHVLSHVSHV